MIEIVISTEAGVTLRTSCHSDRSRFDIAHPPVIPTEAGSPETAQWRNPYRPSQTIPS